MPTDALNCSASLLTRLQSLLTEFYDLEMPFDVQDFLITDASLAAALDQHGRPGEEKLLVAETDGEAEVSLYLAQELLERLHSNSPVLELNAANLGDFWVAFEGVSHFIYFVWRAGRDVPMTLLEMELQAEIDKFIATSLLFQEQGARPPISLHHWLFERSSFDPRVDDVQLHRYQRANYYAAKYCRQLRPRLEGAADRAGIKQELRRFYRLSRPAKIDYIEAC